MKTKRALWGRPDWDTYFLDVARVVASRADCQRYQVGAVVVDPAHRIAATGYNAAPAGSPLSCLGGDCPRLDSTLANPDAAVCIAVHAETNALLYAGRDRAVGAVLYVTREPCVRCWRMAEAAGIERVVWPDEIGHHTVTLPVFARKVQRP